MVASSDVEAVIKSCKEDSVSAFGSFTGAEAASIGGAFRSGLRLLRSHFRHNSPAPADVPTTSPMNTIHPTTQAIAASSTKPAAVMSGLSFTFPTQTFRSSKASLFQSSASGVSSSSSCPSSTLFRDSLTSSSFLGPPRQGT
jgi:hypothetical protein